MVLTQINHQIGSAEAEEDCIAVALLSATAQKMVLRLLHEITQRFGEAVWPMPAGALHITLCEIIQPKPYVQDKTALFKNVPHHESVLRDVLALPTIQVVFDTIEVSQQAIIIRGSDDGAFHRIRSQLIHKLPLPNETKRPPDIIHSSIARFTQELDVDEVRAVVEQFNSNFTENVREFQLLSRTAPHLLNYTVSHRYPLR